MDTELYELAEVSYSSLPKDTGFYAGAAATATIVASRYVEEFGLDSEDADSVLER